MKNSILSLMFSLLCVTLPAFAGASAPAASNVPLSSYMIENPSRVQMDHVANQFEVVKRLPNGFEVLVPQTEALSFLALAPQARLLDSDISAQTRSIFAHSRQLLDRGYTSFDELQVILQELAVKYTDTVELVNYGKSQQGNPLVALRVGRHLKDSKTVPRVLITAATHGDEIITTEVLLALMKEYIANGTDGTNPRFVKLLDEVEVLFVPVVNADGFVIQARYDNGADPNRSYPYPDRVDNKPTASIAAELQLLQQFPVVGTLDFHAYSALVMYPWGYTRKELEPSMQQSFETLTAKMAATNGYGHGQISDILYIAKGSSTDFFFWKYNALALAIELGDSKSPYPSEIPKYIEEQRESTWMFLESFLKASTK